MAEPVPDLPYVEQQRAVATSAFVGGALLVVVLAAVSRPWWVLPLGYVVVLLVVIAPLAWLLARFSSLDYLEKVERVSTAPSVDRTAAARRSGHLQGLGAGAVLAVLIVVLVVAGGDVPSGGIGALVGLAVVTLLQSRRIRAWEQQHGCTLHVRAAAPRWAFTRTQNARRLVAVPAHATHAPSTADSA